MNTLVVIRCILLGRVLAYGFLSLSVTTRLLEYSRVGMFSRRTRSKTGKEKTTPQVTLSRARVKMEAMSLESLMLPVRLWTLGYQPGTQVYVGT